MKKNEEDRSWLRCIMRRKPKKIICANPCEIPVNSREGKKGKDDKNKTNPRFEFKEARLTSKPIKSHPSPLLIAHI